MNATASGMLTDAIQQLQQVEQKVVFVQETILTPPEPVLAHLSVLKNFLMDTYSEHLDSVQQALRVATEETIEQLEEEIDNFEALFKEVSRTLARKHVAAARTSAKPTNAVDQLAAETWLKQQLNAWESLEVDVPEQLDGIEEARNQNLELQEFSVVETLSEFGIDSSRTHSVTQPDLKDSQSMEEPANNPSADASDSTDVANRRPQRTWEEAKQWADPVDHQASTENQKDVASGAGCYQLATNPCLDHVEGGSKAKPGPDPARTLAISEQSRPSRVHLDSGHEVKADEVCNPQLPSMVKAPNKCGHSCSCRFHPDYSANARNDPSGQLGRSQQPREHRRKGWHPTVPPDKTAPSKANVDQLPDLSENLLSYLNRGEYVRFHRSRNPTCKQECAPHCASPRLTASEPRPLRAATVTTVK